VTIVPLSAAILTFVTAQRLSELVIARRNTARLLAAGGREIAPGHYPLIVAVHSVWLAGLWVWGLYQEPSLPLLAVYALLQALRIWVLTTLGRRWTTRIIVVPGETLVARGPYRIISHPNYAVVAGEILVLPLVFGLPAFALAMSAANAVALTIRIRAENAALHSAS
jgi:methyltransferase